MKNYKTILLYLIKPRKGLFTGIFLITLLTSVLEALNVAAFLPVFSSLLHAQGVGQNQRFLNVLTVVSRWIPIHDPIILATSLLFLLMVVKSVTILIRDSLVAYASGAVQCDLKNQLAERYAASPYAFFLEHKQGKLSYDALSATNRTGILMLKVPQLLSDSLKVAANLLLVLIILPGATLAFLALAVSYHAFTHHLSKKVSYHTGKGRAISGGEQMSLMNEFLTGIRQIMVFKTQASWLSKFKKQSRIFRDLYIQDTVWLGIPRTLMELTTVFALCGLIAFSRMLNPKALAECLPLLGAFTVALFQLLPALASMGRERMEVANLLPDAEMAYQAATQPLPKIREGNRAFAALTKEIRFEKVRFAYPQRPPILRELDVTFIKGQTTAIIGSSGSGKTTIVNLLLRLFDPTQGCIRVDGMDLQEFQVASWLQHIGFVSQDPFITHASVSENICFGREAASPEAIEQAARVAHAHEFITQLPQGYATIVGERGMKLSGGQQQRLAIARAVLLHPEILIFDEATSALDTESEKLVQAAIEQISRDRTVILIAHRLSTVQHADRIVYLENGQILEEGNHQELLKAQGRYFKLVFATQ